MYVLIVPHVDIELEDNKQFISNIPRRLHFVIFVLNSVKVTLLIAGLSLSNNAR